MAFRDSLKWLKFLMTSHPVNRLVYNCIENLSETKGGGGQGIKSMWMGLHTVKRRNKIQAKQLNCWRAGLPKYIQRKKWLRCQATCEKLVHQWQHLFISKKFGLQAKSWWLLPLHTFWEKNSAGKRSSLDWVMQKSKWINGNLMADNEKSADNVEEN